MNKSIGYQFNKGDIISSYSGKLLILKQIKIRVKDRGRQYYRKAYKCKCLECNNIYEIREDNLINNKHGCKKCSKGVSYGEKVMMRILDIMNVSYLHDKALEWSNNKRYDFYLPDYNLIIEIHGIQHYKDNIYFNTSFKKEQENDKMKKELAKKNNITHYIVINYSRAKDTEFLLKNIFKSELKSILNLPNNLNIA